MTTPHRIPKFVLAHVLAVPAAAAAVLLTPAAAPATTHTPEVSQTEFVCNSVRTTFPQGRAEGSGNCTSRINRAGPLHGDFIIRDRRGGNSAFCSGETDPSGYAQLPARVTGYDCIPID